MKLYYGYSMVFWIILIVLLLFSSYFIKTIYGSIYYLTTGNEIGSSYYTTTRYGQRDYSYDFGKALFRF